LRGAGTETINLGEINISLPSRKRFKRKRRKGESEREDRKEQADNQDF
jgi:hypothetical protein